jgi:phosphoglycerate dehydrogenase-like enzyme
MLQVAFAGTFPASLEPAVRRHLTTPCGIVVADETGIAPLLADIDVLVTMVLTAEMGRLGTRLKLVQVAGAGIERIDPSAVPAGAGAALDVWYRYPREAGPAAPATRPFRELPNVLMTPHVAGWTDGMLVARARLIAENIRRVAAHETPLNLVAR